MKIPFHKWNNWLETRFDQLKEVYLKEKQQREIEMNKWKQEQELQKELKAKESSNSIFDRIYKFMNRET